MVYRNSILCIKNSFSSNIMGYDIIVGVDAVDSVTGLEIKIVLVRMKKAGVTLTTRYSCMEIINRMV